MRLFAIISSCLLLWQAPLVAEPLEVSAPIDHVFVPGGFDDNDNVEIVAHGDFNHACYRVGKAEAFVDRATKIIKIKATAYEHVDPEQGAFCPQVKTPFIQPIALGVLDAGEYSVVLDQVTESVLTTFTVDRRKTESPDEYLYAPVENAYIHKDASGKQALILQGTFPMWFIGCQVITDVKTYRSPSDVLVVLPVTKVVEGPECDEQSYNFVHRVAMKKAFDTEGLLHVRAMNGASINTFLPGYF